MNVALILVSILFVYILFKYSNNKISPILLLNYIWLLSIILGLFFYNEYEWNYWSIFYILFNNFISFICFQFIFLYKNIKIRKRKISLNKDLAIKLLLGIILLGLFKTFEELRINGYSLKLLFNLKQLLLLNKNMALQRYLGEGKSNLLMQLSSIFIYLGPLYVGYLINYLKIQKKIILLSFIPVLLNMSINNGKIGLIASFFLFLSGYLTGYFEKTNSLMKIKKEKIILIGFIIISIFVVLYISMFFRIGRFEFELISQVNEKFKKYALGHIISFDNWFKSKDLNYSFGGDTLRSIYAILFSLKRIQGAYSLVEGTDSNIFSAYRGLINDFGVIGSGFILYCWAVFVGILHLKSNKKFENIKSVLIASSYFFVMFSIFISPWFYTTYILIFILFYVLLILIKRRRQIK